MRSIVTVVKKSLVGIDVRPTYASQRRSYVLAFMAVACLLRGEWASEAQAEVRLGAETRPSRGTLRRLADAASPGVGVQQRANDASPAAEGTPSATPLLGRRLIDFSGRFVYARLGEVCNVVGDPGCTGADNITVRMWDEDDPITGDELMWEGVTDENGYFGYILDWEDCDIFGCDDPDIYLEIEAANRYGEIEDPGLLETNYKWTTAVIDDSTDFEIDYGWQVPGDPAEYPAVHILNSITRVNRFITDTVFLAFLHKVDVQWPDSETYYDGTEMHVAADEQWNEGMHIHQFGHRWMAIEGEVPDPSDLDYCDNMCDDPDCGYCLWCSEGQPAGPETWDRTIAWIEGWAHWLADVVLRDWPTRYGSTPLSADDPRWNLEAIGTCMGGGTRHQSEFVAGDIAALLRDIEDDGEDADGDGVPDDQADCARDALALGTWEIFDIIMFQEPTTVVEFITAFRAQYPQHSVGLWRTANSIDWTGTWVWPDAAPPGVVTQLNSPTHPLGSGGSWPEISVQWEPAPDDASGATDYSVVWDTSPLEPDFIEEVTGETVAVSPPFEIGEYYLSIRARDCIGQWSQEWSSFGPFEITECNGNGIIDVCDTDCAALDGFCNVTGCATTPDCNENDTPDACDLASGESNDCNNNGMPDECEEDVGANFVHWQGCTQEPSTGSWLCYWDVLANWVNSMTPPGPGDHACIEDLDTSDHVEYRVISGSTQVASVSSDEPFHLTGGELAPDELSVINADFIHSGGTLSGPGDWNVYGTTEWSGGVMRGSGVTRALGSLLLSGTSHKQFYDSRALSFLDADWTGANQNNTGGMIMFWGGSMNNFGTFDVDITDGAFARITGSPQFNNRSGATFTKLPGSGLTTMGIAFNNDGTVDVQGGTLRFTGNVGYTQVAGAMILNGGNVETSSQPLDIQGGILTGEGTVTGSVGSSGEVAPGLSAGSLEITGNYTQADSGILTIELGGLAACDQLDQLNIGGQAALAGTLRIEAIDDCQPTLGQRFEVMSYASYAGAFDEIEDPCAGAGLMYDLDYGPTGLAIVIVEQPAPNGDLNFDSLVDLRDVARFQNCFSGPAGSMEPCCTPADFNGDNAIDLTDYAAFHGLLAGP